jgi:predicted ATPase
LGGDALTQLIGASIVLPVTTRLGLDTGFRPSLSRFFGRDEELSQLRSLLVSDRLVTVIGAGGVGKTRLTLELVRGGLDASPDGVWLVELALVESPDLVGPAIAQTVGALEDRDLDHLERAAGVLSSGRQLLVLDNCEHLLEVVAAAARRLLTQCPELRLLATSQEPLGVEGEQVWRTPPLDLPPAGAHEVADAAATSAVRLFCDRARHAIPTFDLTADNVGDVVAVCRQLDGLPLALELAAA